MSEFDFESEPLDPFGEPEPMRVAVLGSTGSVGTQALDVIRSHPERFHLVALAAASDSEGLAQQSKEFGVSLIGIVEGDVLGPPGSTVIKGKSSAAEVAEAADADIVLNAVMGAAGLEATLASLKSGKTLALANKESLVAAGEFVMARAAPGQIRPVDSEHSAMWQLLETVSVDQVSKAYLTGSGGPFRGKTTEQLRAVSVDQALAHPVWEMGRKITIDSATLMNKGLEAIEAHFLFGFTYDEIEVVIHPEGLVHAMIELIDGSTYMSAAPPDMRLPIQIALGRPDRFRAPEGKRISFSSGVKFSFESPDPTTFRCLDLAFEAGRKGDTYPAALNAANEIAVNAFLNEEIDFLSIPVVIERVLESHEPAAADLESVLEADAWARSRAAEFTEELRS
jgi:1-deoxy-D-xylulose-5-phosphate reductoisomerase